MARDETTSIKVDKLELFSTSGVQYSYMDVSGSGTTNTVAINR